MGRLTSEKSLTTDLVLRNKARVAEEKASFTIFHNELPDPENELADQHVDKRPKIFTLFPELPSEIRLQIWNWTIPRRTLEFECLSNSYRRERCHSIKIPPILQANVESRVEALKHYDMIWRDEAKSFEGIWTERIWADIFCFSPVLDTLSVWEYDSMYHRYFDGLDWNFPGSLDSFRYLELPIFWQCYYLEKPFSYAEFDWLLKMSRLEEIYIGRRWGSDFDQMLFKRNIRDNEDPATEYEAELRKWTLKLETFLKDNLEAFHTGKVPKVVIGPIRLGRKRFPGMAVQGRLTSQRLLREKRKLQRRGAVIKVCDYR